MKQYIIILFVSFIYYSSSAQELFPLTEPASTVPKGVLGLRGINETYQEYTQTRQLYAARIMYGLTSKLTIEITGAESNHHDTLLPKNLISHTHNIQGRQVDSIKSVPRGLYYPFMFAGFNFYAKYRIYSHDAQRSHFRIAVFADYSTVNVAHDEAEPVLINDCGGYEGGLIATKLMDRWAFSLTTDYIHPYNFTQVQTKYVEPALATTVQYGNALEYDLSIGYRFYPDKYTNDYSQNNFNVYVEFMGKSYNPANVTVNGQALTIQTPLLKGGYYVEMHPGIQWIINSNTRIDMSVGYPIIGVSYIFSPFYPVYNFGVQHYFYFTKKPPAVKGHYTPINRQ
ncbi:MAG TPA: hypothetical protein VK890_12375 [Bacteroidia bacterium]|nr:hypothetical protein [Bacteroidia bacterium]